jgi:hypothetical protein
MMPPKKQPESDALLTSYLLAALSPEDAELLDERSIAEDEFSLRLDAVENDLVDAYVRGELSGEALERFKQAYLGSPSRLQKVEFSQALWQLERRGIGSAAAAAQTAIASPKPREESSKPLRFSRWFQNAGFLWGLATAAVVLLLASSILLVQNARLRKQQMEAEEQRLASAHGRQELEKQLNEQRSENAGLVNELEQLRESLQAAQALKTVAVLLLPPTRGAAQIPKVSVSRGTNRVTLRLRLEADDSPSYEASLQDLATNESVWRSAGMKAKSAGGTREVTVTLAASLLKPRNYSIELSGVSRQGSKELLSSYPFKVVVE